ncbi:hypothetical protein ACWDA7_11785 [Streptomyces sp. NPDC001156]
MSLAAAAALLGGGLVVAGNAAADSQPVTPDPGAAGADGTS